MTYLLKYQTVDLLKMLLFLMLDISQVINSDIIMNRATPRILTL